MSAKFSESDRSGIASPPVAARSGTRSVRAVMRVRAHKVGPSIAPGQEVGDPASHGTPGRARRRSDGRAGGTAAAIDGRGSTRAAQGKMLRRASRSAAQRRPRRRRLVAARLALARARRRPTEEPDRGAVGRRRAGCRRGRRRRSAPATRTGISRTSRPSSAAPGELRPAAGQDDPGREHPVRRRACISVRQQLERLAHPGLDDLAHLEPARPSGRPPRRGPSTLITSSGSTPRRSHVPWSILSSSATWRLVLMPIATSLVTLLPPTGRTRGVERRALDEQGQVDRPGADVGDGHAELLLRLGQDRLGRGERVGHQLVDLDVGRR